MQGCYMEETGQKEQLTPDIAEDLQQKQDLKDSTDTEVFDLFKTPAKFQPKQKVSRRVTPKRKFNESPESVKEGDKRPRTPSGQVLTKTVCDIKHMLAKNIQSSQNEHQRAVKGVKSPVDNNLNSIKDIWERCVSAENSNVLQCIQELSQTTNMSFPDADLSKSAIGSVITEAVENIANKRDDEENMDSTSLGNPGVMDVRAVIGMLNDLKIELKAGVREEIVKDPGLSHMRQQLSMCEFRERTMLDVMEKMQSVIKELQDKNEIYEMNNAKRMLVLSGFNADKKRKIARKQILAFMKEQMDAEVNIEDFYYIGTGSPRDIVLIFPSANDKHRVLQQKQQIKNLVNEHGKRFYFCDFKTQQQNETQKKLYSLQNEMQEADPVDQMDVYMEKSRIFIGEDQYQNQITPPNPVHMMKLPMTELNVIMSTKVDPGTQHSVKNNHFTGYTVAANSVSKIQQAYSYIRLHHADARHIVCAWRIPGTKRHECEDFCDDDDIGVGSHILKLLKTNDVLCRAVFVVRKCGEKLQENRVKEYIKCATNTINKRAKNDITGKEDLIKLCEDDPAENRPSYANVLKSPPGTTNNQTRNPAGVGRGRGRGRGRGNGRAQGRGRRMYGGRGGNQGSGGRREADKQGG